MSDLYFLTAGNVAGVTMSVFEFLTSLHEQRRLQGMIAEALIQKYLVKRARQMGLTVAPEDREKILSLIGQNTPQPPDPNAIDREILVAKLKERITADEAKKRFDADPVRFDRLHIRHIVVQDENTIQQINELLKDPSVSFADLARQYSIHEPSRANGGDMGISLRHQLPPRVAQAVINAHTGDIIGPLKLESAYSLLKVEKMIPAEPNPQVLSMMVDELFDVWLKTQLRDEMMDFPLLARIEQETTDVGEEPPDQIRI